MLKYMICVHVGCPHPRILDAMLNDADLKGWYGFFTRYYRKPDG